MEHHFNVDVAKECGINAAVLLYSIIYWWRYKIANAENEDFSKDVHDGVMWVFNSKRAWAEQFPYLTERQVRTALDRLKESNFVITGCYNKAAWDKTLWYSPTSKALAYDNKVTPLDTEVQGPSDLEVQPIPIYSTNTNNSTNTLSHSTRNINITRRTQKSNRARGKLLTYSEYVKLSEEEYNKLVGKHGFGYVQWGIEVLNQYIGEKNGKYDKNHYYVLNGGWVFKRWREEHAAKPAQQMKNKKPTMQETFDAVAAMVGLDLEDDTDE